MKIGRVYYAKINERRSGSDRRQFTYTANISEKRTGMENRSKEERREYMDRRKLVDRRTAVYRSWYHEPDKRSLKSRRNDTDRTKIYIKIQNGTKTTINYD